MRIMRTKSGKPAKAKPADAGGHVQINLRVEREFADLYDAMCTLMRTSRTEGFRQIVLALAMEHASGAVRRGIITKAAYDKTVKASKPMPGSWRSVYRAYEQVLRRVFESRLRLREHSDTELAMRGCADEPT